ncbi:hypothetical protein TB2_014198 [Malus domestica]
MEYFFATAYRYLPPVEDPFRRLSFVLFSHHVTIPLLFQPRCLLTHPQIFTPATCHFSLFSTAPSTDLIYTSAPSPLFGTASSSQPSILYCSNHPIVPKLLHFLFSLHITNILPSFETHNPHSHHRCSSINICFQLLLIRNADFLHFAILPTFLRSVSLYSHAHPSPAATMAPMVVPVTATAQTSTSLVAACTRGTTSNVSTTLFTTPKLPSETNAYSVGSSLCSYFHADGLVNTVLVNHVAPSHLKGYFQTCNDSRVLPPLGTPNDAMEKLPPKVDVLQIAHPIHPPKEPDKGRRCQVKGWENKKQANGHVQDQLTMLDLDYSSMVEELMAVGSEKLKEALASLGLQTGGTVQHAVETTLDSPMTLLTGTFAGGSVLSSHFFVVVLSQDHVIGRAVPNSMVAVKPTAGHPVVAGTPTWAANAYAGLDATADQIQLLKLIFCYLLHCIIHHDPKLKPFRHSRDEKTLEAIEFGLYACSVQPTKQLITVVEDTCCLAPRIIQRSHGTNTYMYCVGLTNIVEKLRCGEHIWHVDCKDLLQSHCKLIIIPVATYLNANSDLEFIAPPFVTSVCGSYEFESYFPEYLHLFKALVALHFQWYHVFATVVSMSMVLTAPSALAVLSNESESVFCQVFSGFVPLGSLAFTLVNDSQQLELTVKVEKLLEHQISLFTDYISQNFHGLW